MTLRSSFQSASLFNKLSFIFSLIAMLMAWISFVMPAWGWTADKDSNGVLGYGLWRRCGTGKTNPGCIDLVGWNMIWYQAFQAFATLGFVGLNLAFVLIILQIFVDKCKGVKEIAFWNGIQCVLTGFCYLVAIITFIVEFDSKYRTSATEKQRVGYSWGLAIVAFLFHGIAVAILQFLEGKSAMKD